MKRGTRIKHDPLIVSRKSTIGASKDLYAGQWFNLSTIMDSESVVSVKIGQSPKFMQAVTSC